MNWKRITGLAVIVIASAVGGYQLNVHAEQEPNRPCTVIIPAAWGDYKGLSTGTGLVFEDKSGTLRIVPVLPCPVNGAVPMSAWAAVEVHRK
jgi:hypothetical protein